VEGHRRGPHFDANLMRCEWRAIHRVELKVVIIPEGVTAPGAMRIHAGSIGAPTGGIQ